MVVEKMKWGNKHKMLGTCLARSISLQVLAIILGNIWKVPWRRTEQQMFQAEGTHPKPGDGEGGVRAKGMSSSHESPTLGCQQGLCGLGLATYLIWVNPRKTPWEWKKYIHMNLKFYLEGKGRVTYANCQLRAPHTLGARKEGLLKAQREDHELGSLLSGPYCAIFRVLWLVTHSWQSAGTAAPRHSFWTLSPGRRNFPSVYLRKGRLHMPHPRGHLATVLRPGRGLRARAVLPHQPLPGGAPHCLRDPGQTRPL